MRFFTINKVPFGAALFGLTAAFVSGYVTFRPNRIAPGKPVFIWQFPNDIWIVVLILWMAVVTVSMLKVSDRINLLVTGILSSILLPLVINTAGSYAAWTFAETGSVARISLGPAFWVSLFMLATILMDTWQRSGGEKLVISLLVAVSISVIFWLLFSGRLDMLSIMREFTNRKERFFDEIVMHLLLVISSVGFALAMGIPLGLLAYRKRRFYSPTFFSLNTLQTIPSLALFGILIPVLASVTLRYPFLVDLGIRGIGAAPAIIALTIYSLLPVARNTYTGFASVDPAAIEAGIGMGMTRTQLLFKVEIPIASPVILNGVRVALVQAIGLTAVAALIGAGGLGVFIFQGLGQAANDLILLGAIPTILIAVAVDFMMNGILLVLQPKGLR